MAFHKAVRSLRRRWAARYTTGGVKRSEVLRRLRKEAMRQGKTIEIDEGSKHTKVTIGSTRSHLGRHAEIDNVSVRLFFDQFADEFGKGWWRR